MAVGEEVKEDECVYAWFISLYRHDIVAIHTCIYVFVLIEYKFL